MSVSLVLLHCFFSARVIYRSHCNVKISTVAKIHTRILSIPFLPYTPKSHPLAMNCNRSVTSVGPNTDLSRLRGKWGNEKYEWVSNDTKLSGNGWSFPLSNQHPLFFTWMRALDGWFCRRDTCGFFLTFINKHHKHLSRLVSCLCYTYSWGLPFSTLHFSPRHKEPKFRLIFIARPKRELK